MFDQFDHIVRSSRLALELAEDDSRLSDAPLHVLLYSGATLTRALVVASRAHALVDREINDVDRLTSARDVIMAEIRRRSPAPISPDAA
jgi:hypothetical protein